MKKITFIAILATIALAFALVLVAQAGNIWLPLVQNSGNGQSGQYPSDGWVITDIWVYQGITYFKLVNNGWTVDAMCIEPNVTPPPVGSVCSLNGDVFTCPGWQGSRIIKIITTPTPTPTATNTPTPTSTPTVTPTPTATPISCYNPCPNIHIRVEYPTGNFKYNVQTIPAPNWKWGALFNMYVPNTTTVKISDMTNVVQVDVKAKCKEGNRDLSGRVNNGVYKFSCADIFYSLTRCDIENRITVQTNCGLVQCNAAFPVVDPPDDAEANLFRVLP